MACILRFNGKSLHPSPVAKILTAPIDTSYARGDQRANLPGRHWEVGGVTVLVSKCSDQDLPGQTRDAESFLGSHFEEILEVVKLSDVEQACLDFAVGVRVGRDHVGFQCERLPSTLLLLAGQLSLAIELSLFP